MQDRIRPKVLSDRRGSTYVALCAAFALFAAACGGANTSPTETGEAFIQAFFSWDAAALEEAVDPADLTGFSDPYQNLDGLLVAQAEMQAVNYVPEETSCVEQSEDVVECTFVGDDDVSRLLGARNPQGYRLAFSDGELTQVEYFAVPESGFLAWVDWLFEGNAPQSLETCRYGPAEPNPDQCAEAQVQSAQEFLASR